MKLRDQHLEKSLGHEAVLPHFEDGGTRHSCSSTRRQAPSLINRKELHSRSGMDQSFEPENDENDPELQNSENQTVNNNSNDGQFY